MHFNTTVVSAHYQELTRSWLLTDANGCQYSCRFLITSMGLLNHPTLPNIPGINYSEGVAMHTARWPDNASLNGKRVGIIGTGATGIQTIQEIVKVVGHLTVFQRTANWSAPLRNSKITPEEMEQIRGRYPEIFRLCDESYACFLHGADNRQTFGVPIREREAFWAELYAKPGFAKWLSNFSDISYNREANAAYSEFMANKIRQRVHDPAIAEKLIPKNHGFGTRRVPLETFYFEAFNRPSVKLMDITEDPIEKITRKGVKTRDEEIELDVLIYATWFDAVTGAFTAVDIQRVNGEKLNKHWIDGPRTRYGLFVQGFPNMMMVLGPHQMFGNIPRSIEYAVDWITDCIWYCWDNNIRRIEATHEGVTDWTDHGFKYSEGLLSKVVDPWMTGVNKNVKHKQTRSIARYSGPAAEFRRMKGNVAARNYQDLRLN
ncbi:uncharacterized protein A1O9_00631 [Exophiala aquamarina CBS 119918]|uniref:Uncharacterized protein n=1 Tax=Exophiala aquamarina CBS 119918 TaxID=1182545 RepID=A0A072PTI5_9EURO|nr:uncharacterized protein A1O9_00631 [Exophiala aquamarina CBS 119918]KEF62658.1 hypothetical protein A1O9_00631 [Exophiala aquamarina CBS 119918]